MPAIVSENGYVSQWKTQFCKVKQMFREKASRICLDKRRGRLKKQRRDFQTASLGMRNLILALLGFVCRFAFGGFLGACFVQSGKLNGHALLDFR